MIVGGGQIRVSVGRGRRRRFLRDWQARRNRWRVNVETVTSQLLYEIGGPEYLGPDVTARFDTIQVEQVDVIRFACPARVARHRRRR